MIKRSPGTKKIKIKAARDSTHQNQILQLRVHPKWPGRRQWMETEERISEKEESRWENLERLLELLDTSLDALF